jgi:hypothetical protein
VTLLVLGCPSGTVAVRTARSDTSLPEDAGGVDTAGGTGAIPDAPLELCINEFMADNQATIDDGSSLYPDWIELHNPGPDAVDLLGWTLTDDEAEPALAYLSGELAAGEFLLLWADGTEAEEHLPFRLAEAGGVVGLRAPDGRGSLVRYGAVDADTSLARATDCCEGSGCFVADFQGTPGRTNTPADVVAEDVVPAGSTWSYWDQGSLPAADWAARTYDDRAWPTGPAPLGYGDSHQVTITSYGADSAAKYPTTYFRLSFTALSVGEVQTLELGLLRDDGAVVYLDGNEVLRSNMPEGDIAYDTYASTSTGAAGETAYWSFDLDPSLLTEGVNVLGVEVHQHSADSTDLGFDLRVTTGR